MKMQTVSHCNTGAIAHSDIGAAIGPPAALCGMVGMSKGKEPKAPAAKPRKGERAFDMWLNRGLHELYDEVVREPVPQDLLNLIEEDRKK